MAVSLWKCFIYIWYTADYKGCNRQTHTPLLDKTSYNTECIMNGTFSLLQYQLVGATHQNGDSVTRILNASHLQAHQYNCVLMWSTYSHYKNRHAEQKSRKPDKISQLVSSFWSASRQRRKQPASSPTGMKMSYCWHQRPFSRWSGLADTRMSPSGFYWS